MAHIQECYGPDELYTSPSHPRSQSQPQFFYNFNRSAAEHPEVSMAQSSLQSPFRPDLYMPQSQWSMSQISPSDSMMFAQTQLRGQHAVSSHDMIWTRLPNELHIDESMVVNNELLYSHNANQNSLRKATDFGNPSFWLSNGMPITASSPSADLLPSPTSPFSDVKHTYSPGSDYSPATPGHSTTSYGRSSSGTKVSSPGFAPPTPQSVIQQRPGSAAMQHGFSVSMTSAGAFPMSNTFKDTSMYGSEHSYEQSQISSSCISLWYPPGYVEENATIAQDPQPAFDSSPNPYLAPLERRSRQRHEQWSNKNAIPTQSHFQTRFMAPKTDSEKAQRSEDDKILLNMKRDGYTYRDIRKKLGGKVAESTLRGRYRSLTKPRSARVRSPKWQEIDLVLMKRYVQEEFDKLDVSQPSLEKKQKPDKILWAKIADRMVENGGSYKFGAATVKRVWRENSQPASTRASCRRSRV